jgi:ATP-binding cassette subfamily B protein
MKLLALLRAHLGPARPAFARAMLLTFLEGLAAALPALAVALGLLRLQQGGTDIAAMLPYALAVPAAVALRMLLIRRAWANGFHAGNVVTETVRNRLLDRMRTVPIGALQRWSAARLATLFSEDGRWINEVSTFSLNRLFGGLAAGACLLACVFVFDAVTALCVILAFGLGLAAMPIAARVLKRLLSARNTEIAGLNQLIGEYGEGIAVFRSFCAGDGAFARLSAAARRMRKLMLDSTPQIVSLQGLAAFAMTLALPFALLAFAWRGEAGLSLWLVPAFFLALAASQALAMAVLPQALVVMLGIQAEANISRFLAEPVLGGHVTEPGRPLALKLDGAHLRYGADKPDSVSDVSFEVRPGATVAIVGPSGAGKSSLLALMLRFVDPTDGRVFLGGTDLSTLDPARLQALTGFVNQDVHLFRDTLRANLLLGDPQASDEKLWAAIRAARLEELIAALPAGLDTRIGEGGRTLSGGERQRVAVARALLKDAPILLLDEASSAMDPLNERAIQQAIAALEDGRTVVVVAHRLRSIAGADQILVMEAGQIVERGRHDELLALGGLYARLWQAQDRAAGWRLR